MIKYMKKIELKNYGLLIILNLLIFIIFRRLWNWDLSVPFEYDGDILGLLESIKMKIRNESFENVIGLAVPFGTNRYNLLQDGIFNMMIINLFATITKNVGLTVNLYYMITFPLAACCAYFVCRKFKISQVSSFICGTIYAFIPGHIFRGEGHLFVGSCFVIPLVCLAVFYLFNGDLCSKSYRAGGGVNAFTDSKKFI